MSELQRGIRTIGLEVFMLVTDEDNPNQKKIVKLEDVQSITVGTDTVSEIDVTCYGDLVDQTRDGRATTSEASVQVIADRNKYSHRLLEKMSRGVTLDEKNNIKWAVGLGDNGDLPKLNDSKTDWEFDDTDRVFIQFLARVTSFPFSLEQNDVMRVDATLKRSSTNSWSGGESVYPEKYELEITDDLGFILQVGNTNSSILAKASSALEVQTALESLDLANAVGVSLDGDIFTIVLTAPKERLKVIGGTLTVIE